MKVLIKKALEDAFAKLEKQVPKTKLGHKSINIDDVEPMLLPEFIVANNIPNDAYFVTNDDEVCLQWSIEVQLSEVEILVKKKRRFEIVAWSFVYEALTTAGFKRAGCDSGLLEQFKDTTVYDMYTNNQWDRLVSYYSLRFRKED